MIRKKAVSSEIRKINRNLIFHYIYDHPAVTKQALADALNMSLPTITQNLTELSSRGLVKYTHMLESTGGRKARALSINSGVHHAVGLDVTANHIGIVIVNLAGHIIASRRIRERFSSTKEYFRGMAALIEDLLNETKISHDTILGVGIAVPAIITDDGSRLAYASILNFTNGRLADFSEFIPYPCHFVNDANAGGFAEYWNNPSLRNASGEKGVVYLSVNNSVGGTFLLDGNTYSGQHQRASEFGHMTIEPNGRACYCGQRGHADAYLAASLLADQKNGSLAAFFSSLAAGCADTAQAWEKYMEYLVIVVNNLHMAFDCNVIIGGYVGGFVEPYLPRLREMLAGLNPFMPDGSYLQGCVFKHEATAVGASLLYIDELLKSI
jgi:predicted NBD/HSP70 family sugar kinase